MLGMLFWNTVYKVYTRCVWRFPLRRRRSWRRRPVRQGCWLLSHELASKHLARHTWRRSARSPRPEIAPRSASVAGWPASSRRRNACRRSRTKSLTWSLGWRPAWFRPAGPTAEVHLGDHHRSSPAPLTTHSTPSHAASCARLQRNSSCHSCLWTWWAPSGPNPTILR